MYVPHSESFEIKLSGWEEEEFSFSVVPFSRGDSVFPFPFSVGEVKTPAKAKWQNTYSTCQFYFSARGKSGEQNPLSETRRKINKRNKCGNFGPALDQAKETLCAH